MSDTATQLREYLDATAAPVELDEVLMQGIGTDAVRPLETRRGGRQRRDWWYAPAAAAVVFLLLGAAALLIRLTASPDTTTPEVEDVSSLTWSRVPYDEAAFGYGFEQAMTGVAVGGPGLVAVGHSGYWPISAVWTSTDGISWSRVPHTEDLSFGTMVDVTAGGPGFVAVGEAGASAAVWTSPDGITWTKVPHGPVFFGGVMRSVTVGGPGLVAVGPDYSPEAGPNAAVWTSPDGFSWTRVPHSETVLGDAEMNNVTAGGPGLVAVGFSGDPYEMTNAVVWTSLDGIAWSRVPHDEAVLGDAEMRSVTAGGPGLVAVGPDAVWTSADGITWIRIAHDDAFLMSVASVGDAGLVAVGSGAEVWTSPDGINWSRVPHDDDVFGRDGRPWVAMSSVTAGGPGVVAVGAHGRPHSAGASPSDAAVWLGVPEE